MRDYLDKIDEIMQERRSNNPIIKEFNKLTNEIYPVKSLEGIYKLGYCSALSDLKNKISKYFCEYDIKTIDEWIEFLVNDKSGDYNILNDLIK